MGLFTDVTQVNKTKVEAQGTLIKKTRNGAVILCPECKGRGSVDYFDYGIMEECQKCHGGGAIEIKVVKEKA